MTTEAPRLTDVPAHQRPRERLRRLGADALTDAEVVAILLGSGRPGANVLSVAQRVIDAAGGMAGLATLTVDDAQRVPGVGPAAASRLVAAIELRRRASLSNLPTTVASTADIAAAVMPYLQDRVRERVVLAIFDRRLRLLDVVSFPEGSGGHASVPVADVLSTVLRRGGHAFAVAHNHPNGATLPSETDLATTNSMSEAARACGLRFLDHLVYSAGAWCTIKAP